LSSEEEEEKTQKKSDTKKKPSKRPKVGSFQGGRSKGGRPKTQVERWAKSKVSTKRKG